jgi:hypothetical protein
MELRAIRRIGLRALVMFHNSDEHSGAIFRGVSNHPQFREGFVRQSLEGTRL